MESYLYDSRLVPNFYEIDPRNIELMFTCFMKIRNKALPSFTPPQNYARGAPLTLPLLHPANNCPGFEGFLNVYGTKDHLLSSSQIKLP